MLLCVAAVATLSSCSKDNEVLKNEDLIIGKWKYTQQSSDGVNWVNANWSGLVLTVNADGTYEGLGMINYYSISGSSLTLGSKNYEIVSLTKEELILKHDPSSGESGDLPYDKFQRM